VRVKLLKLSKDFRCCFDCGRRSGRCHHVVFSARWCKRHGQHDREYS